MQDQAEALRFFHFYSDRAEVASQGATVASLQVRSNALSPQERRQPSYHGSPVSLLVVTDSCKACAVYGEAVSL